MCYNNIAEPPFSGFAVLICERGGGLRCRSAVYVLSGSDFAGSNPAAVFGTAPWME